MHEDTFARVEFFFSIIVIPNPYPWSVTFFSSYFYLLTFLFYFLTITVTSNPYPWSVNLFSCCFLLIYFSFYVYYFLLWLLPLTLTLDRFFFYFCAKMTFRANVSSCKNDPSCIFDPSCKKVFVHNLPVPN